MHSITGQQRSFYYLLLGVFFFHAIFLAVKFKDHFTLPQPVSSTEAIKVKIIQEIAKQSVNQFKKQIVQSEDSDSLTKPEKEAFLSDKDRSFDRETIAKNIDTFKKAALGNAAVTQVSKRAQPSKKKAPQMKDLKLSDFGFESGEMVPKMQERSPASISQKGMENGDRSAIGLSSTNDYVQEVALGDFTHLNTVEYKFYGFYHRIRQKLEQFWGQSIQEKSRLLFRSGRRMPAGEDLITSVRITLDAQGEIVAVKITGSSGVKELDDAAVESFNLAGPFPNPPKELLVDGRATIEWGFVVKS